MDEPHFRAHYCSGEKLLWEKGRSQKKHLYVGIIALFIYGVFIISFAFFRG